MIQSLYRIVRNFSRKTQEDFVPAFSAQAAFFIIISFFPFLMFLLTLLRYLPLSESSLVDVVIRYMPEDIQTFLIGILGELHENATTTLLSATVIAALWSAARGFIAIMKGLNGVYRINESRNYFVLRFLAAIYTLIFSLLIIVTLGILVFGNRIYLYIQAKFPVLSDMAMLIISLRTIVGFCILVLFFLGVYIFIPNRKTHLFKELPGAIVSAGGWMLFSYAYSYYIDHMENMSYMYGSLAAIVLCMLWVYFCMYIMFVGAEINVILQHKEMLNEFNDLKREISHTKNLKADLDSVKKLVDEQKKRKNN